MLTDEEDNTDRHHRRRFQDYNFTAVSTVLFEHTTPREVLPKAKGCARPNSFNRVMMILINRCLLCRASFFLACLLALETMWASGWDGRID